MVDECLQLTCDVDGGLQVSDPYSSTDLTFELKILSFVLSEMFWVLQILFKMLNVVLAFPILAFTSSSVPPSTANTSNRIY